MIKQEHLTELKAKYQERADYYKKLGFDVLASDFQEVANLIKEMEKHIKESVSD